MKTPSTPKITLKSSIRGNSTTTPSTSEIPSTRTTPAKSLRSMKSMIAKQKGPATQSDVSRFGSSRIRSRTGEDVSPVTKLHKSLVPIPKSKSKSNPSTPQLSHRISTFRSPQPLRASQVASQPSSIPRTKLPQRNVVNDSGSELERQFARTLSPGRLVVTNAIIVPSSSESEASDREKEPFRSEAWTPRPTGIATRNPSRDIVDLLPPNRSPRPLSNASRKPVGLGFNLDADLNGPSQRFDIDEDDESVYDAEEAFAQPLLKDEVIPSRYSDDEDSIYEEDLDHPHERRAQLYSAVQNCLSPEQEERQDEAECKRREALLGIVDGLHLDFGLTDATYRQSILSESESDNNYSAQGLAISGSGDFQDRANDIVHPTILEEQFSCEEILSDGDSFIEELEQQSASSLRNRRQSVMHSTRSPSSSRSLQKSRQSSNTESTSRSHLSPSVPSPRALWDRHLSTSPRSLRATLSPEPRHGTGRGSIDLRTTSTQDKSPCNSRTSLFNTRSTIQCASPISQDRCNDIHSNVSHDLMDISRYDDTAAEREAFGIPASLSYGGNVTPEEEVACKRPPIVAADSISSLEIGLTRVDSDSSLMDGGRWSEQTRSSKELSKGAAALFKTLTVKGGYARSRGAEGRSNPDRYSPAIDRQRSYVSQQGHGDREILRPKRSLDSLSVSSSASTPSIYDEDINDTDPDTAGTSWRSTLQPSIYNTLRSHYGPVEMQRQELIYELFISEQEFVRHLRSIVKLFILPLRSRDSKTWLPGVPTEVSKLFDWLEDIVNLHGSIARSLKTVAGIWRTGAIVERLAETLRAFIPRLEVYQPYIVRLDEVKDTIVDYLSDDNGEFGEYLRMKERDVQNDGSRLEHLLEEPVVRLSKYTDIFQVK
ncbi:hypothetical protein A0H81_06917 [Grifola frondosa]|uniref:DH domain-containing protein n=1 Tax=Grifola frondosa TaxID=5627 RepID=A0A1C7M8I4_GRIFR|nr:hypothetical protein A0H81_06917 [Grifola frondosa]